MQLPGYQQWVEVFDKDISQVWQSECEELQKAAMLFNAFQRELQNVRVKVEKDFFNLRQQLDEKKNLEQIRLSSVSTKCKKSQLPEYQNKENEHKSPKSSTITHRIPQVESPDLFKNIYNLSNNSDFDDLLTPAEEDNTDYDITNIERSPTISRRSKKMCHQGSKLKQPFNINENDAIKNIFQKELDNMSVIECTPETARKKTDLSKGKVELKKNQQKSKSVTLTKAFSASLKRKVKPVNCVDTSGNSNSEEIFYNDNSDEDQMQICDILNYINQNEQMETDCTEQELDICNTPNKKLKFTSTIEPEPVVRGNARKQLNAFSCEKCAKFYGNMKLSAEELKRKMDECSKHRYTFQPPEDTMPGYWDLSIRIPPK